ncbi:unnamed protein product [Pieris macdunnoughi]|uniref:DNA-directed DNA polymerase n=1 Tax=Pieris macdunnoughi TaxID=345717 RepID=A0A821LHC8_9NEOP|nr:unnamed protein product [Pieris macdunnoughi]
MTEERVIDHCHLTGKIRGVAHSSCNLKYTNPHYVPIFFHNLSGYDSNLFIKELAARDGENISCLPLHKEKYISFSKKIKFKTSSRSITVRFVDSFKFMPTSLKKLVKNLSPNQFQILPHYVPNPELMDLIMQKGVFPYEYIDCWSKLEENSLPDKQLFYSELTQTHISDHDYLHAQKVWQKFECSSLGEYFDLYLKTDILLLAEVFENFRGICLGVYELDPCRYLTAPGLSWDAMLKETGVNLELLTDYEMLQFIQSGIRGGISQVSKRKC